MKNPEIPACVAPALSSAVGMVCRHGPDGEVERLCMATRLETGLWATVHDRGVYGDRIRGRHRGTLEVVDLHLHVGTGDDRRALPVRWATKSAIDPIALLGVPHDDGAALPTVGAAEMAETQYRRIHVPAPTPIEGGRFFGPTRASDVDPDAPFAVKTGATYGPPRLQTYRSGASDAHRVGRPSDDLWGSVYDEASRRVAVCVQGDLDHSRDAVLGAPVVDDEGRLAGVVIGAGQGGEYEHVGAYVPVDVIMPLAAVAKTLHRTSLGRGAYTSMVEFVSHESTEVDFD